MKRSLLLAGILLPFIGFTQSLDSNRQSKLLTASPCLGGVTLTDAVTPLTINGTHSMVQQHVVDFGLPLYKDFTSAHPVFIKSGFRYENLLVPNINGYTASTFGLTSGKPQAYLFESANLLRLSGNSHLSVLVNRTPSNQILIAF